MKKPKPPFGKYFRESSELAYGQSVIVAARWILVVTGLFLILWNPDPLNNLRIQVMTIIMLALMNFYLQTQILMGQKALAPVVYAASIVDFVVITLLIWLNGGFASNTYVFYFPAILAISVAFETAVTIGFVGSAASLYFLLCLGTGAVMADNFPALLSRILMMVAIAFCSNLYWHIERNRRSTAQKAHERLLAEIRRGHIHAPKTNGQEDDNEHVS
ncbi:MAG: hypothetical protein GY796_03750 [Chloroflexi bacterium]|nr:hypothetical protein [Chloroflexota bacterium]